MFSSEMGFSSEVVKEGQLQALLDEIENLEAQLAEHTWKVPDAENDRVSRKLKSRIRRLEQKVDQLAGY